MEILVTAGATRNPVDAIRYLSAGSSGRTGIAIAAALAACGASPRLFGSEEAVLRARLDAPHLPAEVYGSTRDLMARMERWIRNNPQGAVVHAAAVGDYELASPEASKIPSGQAELVLRLSRAPKIADRVRDFGLTGPYVTFKAAAPETDDDALVAIAAAQRARTGCDRVFANVLGRLHARVALVGDDVAWYAARADAIDALVRFLAG